MIQLIDGPAKGSYAVKRAPLFLRAVVGPGGKTDVLDQLSDRPSKGETVHVYMREGEPGFIHLNARGKGGRNISGFYATGTYYHLPHIDGTTLTDRADWQRWAVNRAKTHLGCTLTGQVIP